MSCMQKVLELKGSRPFLKVNPTHVIEGGGVYRGYDYLITFVHHHRCGYVAIPAGHPVDLINEDTGDGLTDYLDDQSLSVHGGITFHSRDKFTNDLLQTSCNDKWIGFDAMHWGDKKDFRAAEIYDIDIADVIKHVELCVHNDSVKDFDYMQSECKQLIDQLIEMECNKNG